MFSNLVKKLSKETIIGGLAISGTLYFGYKNVSEYFSQNPRNDDTSQHYKINKNDILSENLRKLYNNFNKKDLSLRNGDLVFIKYNLEKLGFLNKYKMLLVRNLSKNRIYDDLGIIYCKDDNYYIVLLPSVKIKSKSELRDLNISRKKYRGVVAVEYDDLVKENHPDLISIRRLICSDSTRENVVKSLKSAILELKLCVNYGFVSTLSSWIFSVPYFDYDCSKFINALTYKDELEYAKKSLNYNAVNIFTNINDNFYNKNRINVKQDKQIQEQGNETQNEDNTEYMIENLIDFEKTFNEYDEDIKKYNLIIEKFLEKVQNGKVKNNKSIIGTETSLVSKVYTKSTLLPFTNKTYLFNIYNFFELDSLYKNSESNDPIKYSRLSSPFNVYTGGVNRIRFQNLKYPQIRDVLEYKM